MASVNAGTHPFVRLWSDKKRFEQIRRIEALQRQACDAEALEVWKKCNEIKKTFPKGVRVDLPSVHVFSALLGVIRTTVKIKKDPMLKLELSAQDFADKIHYDKSTVESALRWLGEDAITYRGEAVAQGLGIIERSRRKGCAFVKGVEKLVYRTTITTLTAMGRVLLRLALIVEEKVKQAIATVAPEAQPEPVEYSKEEMDRQMKACFDAIYAVLA